MMSVICRSCELFPDPSCNKFNSWAGHVVCASQVYSGAICAWACLYQFCRCIQPELLQSKTAHVPELMCNRFSLSWSVYKQVSHYARAIG